MDGKPNELPSEPGKGPNRQPRPAGSRMGPQNMVVCGWALQALESYGDIWEERHEAGAENDQLVFIDQFPPDVPTPEREAPFFEFKLGPATLGISSTLHGLKVQRRSREQPLLLNLFSGPNGEGLSALLRVTTPSRPAIGLADHSSSRSRSCGDPRTGSNFRCSFLIPSQKAKRPG